MNSGIYVIWKATKNKNDKNLHTLCRLSKKIENPPPLILQQFQPLFGVKIHPSKKHLFFHYNFLVASLCRLTNLDCFWTHLVRWKESNIIKAKYGSFIKTIGRNRHGHFWNIPGCDTNHSPVSCWSPDSFFQLSPDYLQDYNCRVNQRSHQGVFKTIVDNYLSFSTTIFAVNTFNIKKECQIFDIF